MVMLVSQNTHGFRSPIILVNTRRLPFVRCNLDSRVSHHEVMDDDDIVMGGNKDSLYDDSQQSITRRCILSKVGLMPLAAVAVGSTSPHSLLPMLISPAVAAEDEQAGIPVIKTPSGLKYIDLKPGTGITPQYGNLCSIQYTAYVKLAKTVKDPNPSPIQYDKVTEGYLIKHGNGRMIPGLDEGLHTMKVGGYRRIIIPPKLGYIDNGLGPIPEYPWQRYRLNSLLDEMVAIGAGTIIFEVKLLSVIEDEADQGYYSDDSLSPEDFATLRENLRIKGLQQRAEQQQ